jgi:hypothetical protein
LTDHGFRGETLPQAREPCLGRIGLVGIGRTDGNPDNEEAIDNTT